MKEKYKLKMIYPGCNWAEGTVLEYDVERNAWAQVIGITGMSGPGENIYGFPTVSQPYNYPKIFEKQ